MQNKNRKGFTLIELLAVIVILAIIALIAVPVIMNVITKARISAFEDSAYGIVKAGEMYYTNKLLDAEGMTKNEEFTVTDNSFQNEDGDKLEISGSLPSSGKVTVTSDGEVALVISNGEYCIRKATTESKVKAEKLSDLGGTCDYKTAFTTTTDGKDVPACITNNTECSAGTKVGVQVKASEKYDFYVMSEDTETNEITLIMSENLGGTIAWSSEEDYGCGVKLSHCSNPDKGPITALKTLEDRTSSWTNILSKTYTLTDDNTIPRYTPMTRTAKARLITHSELIKFECQDFKSDSCPSWLYENLGSPDFPTGYWTSSVCADSSETVWLVAYGAPRTIQVYYGINYGIRPVITISKTIM